MSLAGHTEVHDRTSVYHYHAPASTSLTRNQPRVSVTITETIPFRKKESVGAELRDLEQHGNRQLFSHMHGTPLECSKLIRSSNLSQLFCMQIVPKQDSLNDITRTNKRRATNDHLQTHACT